MIPIIEYDSKEGRAAVEKLISRRNRDFSEAQKIVEKIIADVKLNGDRAVFEYTKKLDGAEINAGNLIVDASEFEEAYENTDERLIMVFKKSIERITDYHLRQKTSGWMDTFENGEMMGQLVRPLHRVGIYTPGGAAPLASSLLMCAVPAKVAGVKEIIVATPPDKNGKIHPALLVAAAEAGVTEIYKAGGAQAIAMMAFGTESVSKVDKIAGPGSIYTALAKRCVYGHVGVDSIAGPSEILIIADESAKPQFIAADLLAQAEHGEPAPAILVTTDDKLAVKVIKELESQIKDSPRKDIIKKSLKECGIIFLADNLKKAVKISNFFSPEHLEICVKDPLGILGGVTNAGAVFLGNYTPEALGDYIAGPSHVLPTGGTARFFSPLSVDDFVKKSSVLSFNKKSFKKLGGDVCAFAEAEGLYAHAESIRVRM